jgi:pyruvate formate-lyase activating enzyme-like uncharacterized protein
MNIEGINPNLSKGCRCCLSGKWVCIFLTYRCQAGCPFCPAPFRDDRVWTEFGSEIGDVLAALDTGDYEGVGFSGGDCFLVPRRLIRWLTQLNTTFPSIYYWVYTNGLAASPDLMQQVASLGIREIRFNTAATGYDHLSVLRHLEAAVKIFDFVAIEIPSIPVHFEALTTMLPRYADMGVTYLNLHELIIASNDRRPAPASRATCKFNLVGQLTYDAQSKTNTENIIAFCRKMGLPLTINNCSIQLKEVQMRYRRINHAKRVCRSWERVTQVGLLETYCKKAYVRQLLKGAPSHDPAMFAHPDAPIEKEDYQRVHFMPPMDSVAVERVLFEGSIQGQGVRDG